MFWWKSFRQWWKSKPKDRTNLAKAKGDWGEAQACTALEKKGYRLIARNWKSGKDEIDLIMVDRDFLVFIEVKVRNETARTDAYFAVDRRKKKALRRACKAYAYQLKNKPKYIRFDIYAISMKTNHPAIERHFQNIPLFGKHFHFN